MARKPKIEYGVPAPVRRRYRFSDMEPGGSFFVNDPSKEGSLRTLASRHNKDGKQFTVELVVKRGRATGVRVHRIT